MTYDPYPTFSDAHKAWFNTVLEGMVKEPARVNFARIKGGRDLEIMIRVAPIDVAVFTDAVCLALQTLVAQATGVLSPVIYLENKPHSQAVASFASDQYMV